MSTESVLHAFLYTLVHYAKVYTLWSKLTFFLIIANIRGHFVNHSNQTFHVNCHLDRDYAGVNSFGEARGM